MQGVKGCTITSAEHLITNGPDQWRTWGEEPREVTKQEPQSESCCFTQKAKKNAV